MAGKLTEPTLTALRWSRRLNAKAIGFLGPTVLRDGPLPLYEAAVAAGLLRCRYSVRHYRNPERKAGYWITPAGRLALQEAGGGDA